MNFNRVEPSSEVFSGEILLKIIRILVGLLFIFSGFIKLNDPLGFSYKLEEYFEVFGMEPLKFLSLFLSIFFCTLEVILGFALLMGFKLKWVIPGILILILFFTFLTFYSAYFNKVTECGCFGDAIKLTPWQSFYKNLFLTSLILVLVYFYSKIKPGVQKREANWVMIFVFLTTLGFGFYSYWFLPLMDFLPYKVGNHLLNFIEIPKGEKGDEFSVQYTLKNSKTGELKIINDKEYIRTKIYENKDWIYQKASEPILIKAGYQAPAKDFKVMDSMGQDQTKTLLQNKGYTLWIVEYDLFKTSKQYQKTILELIRELEKKGIKALGLTSVTPEQSRKILGSFSINYPLYYCDNVPLKSMVRSNPGFILVGSGTILAKWSIHYMPTPVEVLKKCKTPL